MRISALLFLFYVLAVPVAKAANSGHTSRSADSLSRSVKNPGSAGNKSPTAKPGTQIAGKLTGPGLYQKARQYFAAGRYTEAIQYAAAAQRRLPASKLPAVLVAQSYYRIGNVRRAGKIFLSIPLAEMPREAAVEYLFTMFAVRRYQDVIKSYPLVPDNHPYRDIARFYLGSAYIQLRLYQKANAALRGAKKIPSTLKSERRELLAYIKQLRQAERQGAMAQGPAYSTWGPTVYVPPPVEVEPQKPLLPGGVPGKAPEAKPAPPKSGVIVFATPGVNIGIKSSKVKQAATETISDSQTPKLTLDLGLKYLGEPRSFGGQPTIDLGFSPIYSSTDSKEKTSKLEAPVDNPENVRNVTTTSSSKSKTTTQTYSAGFKYPLSDPIDVAASYAMTNKVSESDTKSESESAEFSASLTGDFDAIDFSAEYSLSSSGTKGDSSTKNDTTTSKLSVSHTGDELTTSLSGTLVDNRKAKGGIKSSSEFDLGATRSFDDITLEVNAVKADNVRQALSAGGTALSKTGLKAELTYSLGIGLTLSGLASYFQEDNVPVLNEGKVADGPEEVLAKGSLENYVATIKFAPVSFASASVSYDASFRGLKVSDESFRAKLAADNWTEKFVTAINVGFSYTF